MSGQLERLWYPEKRESWARRLTLSPLLLPEGLFRAGVGLRGVLYDRGLLQARRPAGVRILSVGNLNVGGAGKTPLTILLAQRLQAKGERVVVLTRGYGRKRRTPVEIPALGQRPSPAEAGDEPLLIAGRCPGTTVLVGSDRVALAEDAVTRLGATVLLLDDGLQHRRLGRDADLVVIDAGARFGNGHLLPRGPLREPLSSLTRARLACVRVSAGQEIPTLSLPIPHFVARYQPSGWLDPLGQPQPLSALSGRSVRALTAIARPSAFASTLEHAAGVKVRGLSAFPDHHPFTGGELQRVSTDSEGEPIVTTEKDRIRLPSTFPVWTLQMDLRIEAGEALLEAVLAGA